MEANNLTTNGGKLIDRLSKLEELFSRQGHMVGVRWEHPSADGRARVGFNAKEELSEDEITKPSNAVQPRMLGKQANHNTTNRHLILERLQDLNESLGSRPSEDTLATAPPGLRSTLLPHQLHALAWLQWRETQHPRAGILADDMGLGKTITMISLIVSDKQNKIDDDLDNDDDEDILYSTKTRFMRGGTLVVCPASLIQQWASEVSSHYNPHVLSVCLHHGKERTKEPAHLTTHDLVVTTYNIVQRDIENDCVLQRIRWRRVILDEAHQVRNYKSATCGAVTALTAARRWCLTGTPVQNKDLDLYALIRFIKCSPFDDLFMWMYWIGNKSLGGPERLSILMQSLLLRRTKAELQQRGHLASLPQKHIHERHVTLSQPESNVYLKLLSTSKTLFAQYLHHRLGKKFEALTHDQYEKINASQGVKPEILVLVFRLRQLCCHCGLIATILDANYADEHEDPAGQDPLPEFNKLSMKDSRAKGKSKNSDEEEEEEEGPAQKGDAAEETIKSVLCSNNSVFQLDRRSSKIEAVMQCLRNDVFVNKDDKAVVVSQWTSVLRLVEQELQKDRVKYVTISGNVPVPERTVLIKALNDPKSSVKVMLLSLCAGGAGLNLVGANHLLLIEPHWNPQLEAQAQDRVYRVGQKKDVNIYKFMCVNTVEQSIRQLQEAKLEMAESVLTGAKITNFSKLTIEDLKILLNTGK